MAQQLGTVVFAARQHPWDVAGRTVAVIGQGSAGLFWTWSLKRAGAARVIVADRSPSRLAASASFGADVLVDARADDLTEAVMDLTGGEGADFVVEAVGRRETLLQSIGLCRTGGQLFWFGLPDTNDPVPIDFRLFFRRKLTAFSTYGAQGEPGLVSFRLALRAHPARASRRARRCCPTWCRWRRSTGLPAGRHLRGRRAQGVDLVLSAPLVEAMPVIRPSCSAAARSALATALNWASVMWCGSRPSSTRTCRAR